jgi:septum formation protein
MWNMLILASQSPRRSELLRNAGVDFEVQAVDVDESLRPDETPHEYVRRLALDKAVAALKTAPAGAVVLGADTTVLVDGQGLGKPVDKDDARRMLRLLSGRTHEVITGVCVARLDGETIVAQLESETTEVDFILMNDAEIEAYIATGEPMDKAGAYAIQGRASRWIPRVRGCYFNVVGLPVARTCAMLARAQLSASNREALNRR